MVSFPAIFSVPSLYALFFIQKTFCDLFLLFFVCLFFVCVFELLFRNGKREEGYIGGEVKGKTHGL